jgi:two-component system, chemotaxis family, CheB/CheR fusion protein
MKSKGRKQQNSGGVDVAPKNPGARCAPRVSEKTKRAFSSSTEIRLGRRSREPKPDAEVRRAEALRASGLVRFPIAAIGASAGGLEAFAELLQHLPADTGMGFVVVQHLAPEHESILPQILARTTAMPVHEAAHEMHVAPNEVYVIPANAAMSIAKGQLKLGPRELSRGQLRSIDLFLKSLAQDCGENAIGVVLSGMDFDGTAGLEAIKAEGGITFAQDEASAKFPSMPRSAAASGFVDKVLPPGRIGEELGRLGMALRGARDGNGTDAELFDEQRCKLILQQIRLAKKVDLSLYKASTLKRRIHRRMMLHRIDRIEAYLRFLRAHPEELEALYQDVLINVTGFFRDPDLFEFLQESAFPKIIRGRRTDAPLRIWVAGCSMGQEAYSLAIAFLEFAAQARTQFSVQIFATDLNESVLEKARAGFFTRAQVQEISEERLRRFFVERDGGFHVCKPIREMCVFARHDVTGDPPFSRMDLVSCRNLLIYFDPQLQKKVIPFFHYALKPGGFLVLGPSETIGEFSDLFALENSPRKVYTRKSQPAGSLSHGEPQVMHGGKPSRPVLEQGRLGPTEAEMLKEADRVVLAKYAPAGVVVNASLKVVQFRGATGHYLEPMPGKATFDVLKLAREGLLMPLRNALQAAKKENRPVRQEGVRVRFNGDSEVIDLEVIPLTCRNEPCFLIVFEPAAPNSPEQRRLPMTSRRRRQLGRKEDVGGEIARLHAELAASREYVQALTEQHEAATEELQASNEEAHSANEELQSINEELQTTKEELQSTNEELQTVNDEMIARNLELQRANNDVTNVLSGVHMSVVVLDRALRIRRFTPLAEKVLNLVSGDRGRPITHIRPNIQFADLEQYIGQAIDQAQIKNTEVQDRQGRWYSLRVLPYQTEEKKVEGAVLVLTDIDALRRSEERIQEAFDFAQGTVDSVREPMLVLNGDLRVESANRSFYHHFRVSPEETLGMYIYELGHGHWNIPHLRQLLERVLPENTCFDDFEVEQEFERIGRRTMLLNTRRIPASGKRRDSILLAIEDITEREAVESLRQSEERYRTLADSLPQLVWTCHPNGHCDYFNAKYSEYTGVPREELLGDGWREVMHPEDREATCEYWFEALQGEVPYDLNYRLRRADGAYRWFNVRALPLRDRHGSIIKWFGACNDIHEQTQARQLLEQSERWLRLIVQSVKDFAIFTLDTEGRVSSWNSGAEALFGYTQVEILGQPSAILFTPEDRAQQIPEKEVAVAAGEGCAADERWHLRKDGSRFFTSGALRAIRDETGRLRGFTKVARDITDRKRQEDELRRARDELEEIVAERTARLRETIGELESFSYSVSHDMRAPLRAMLSFAQALKEDHGAALGEEGCLYLNRIITAGQRLDHLVCDILSYSRTLQTDLRLQPVNLEELILDATLEDPSLQPPRIQVEIRKPLLPVMGHPAALTQCISNLLSNAAKFVSPGASPRITVWTEPVEQRVRVCFKDNGIGIPPGDLNRIFALFERGHSYQTFEGTGVGLAIVKKSVERMGGSVGVESQLGEGSCFWLLLDGVGS